MNVIMEPALWGTLPRDILFLVFARLPVFGINQLRVLSKDWKREVETPDTEFNRVLEGTGYPSMFGLICWNVKSKCHGLCGRLFDVKSNRWHDFPVDAADAKVIPLDAADGGLVCFVSQTSKKPLFIIVMNPLTGRKAELPDLLGMDGVVPTVQPMVQLIMDGQKQHYKVFAAGYMDDEHRHPFAQVYDSKTKGWTIVGSGQRSWDPIAGCEYDGDDYYSAGAPWVYDFEKGQLQDFGWPSSVVQGTFEVLKNRLFVLHEQERPGPANLVPGNDSGLSPNYGITEYYLQRNAQGWVKLETHDCSPSNDFSRSFVMACDRYLLVMSDISGIGMKWFYDLSTLEWRQLPELNHHVYGRVDLMCELRWDAVP